MRFELRHAFSPSPSSGKSAAPQDSLPPEISFLTRFGVDHAVLRAAVDTAGREQVGIVRALLAYGGISASFYYRALARHLDLPFVDDWPEIEPLGDPLGYPRGDPLGDFSAAQRKGCVRLAAPARARWLGAPGDEDVQALLRATRSGFPDLAITTPAHLAALIHFRAQAQVERAASDGLPDIAPNLSAKGAGGLRSRVFAAIVILSGAFGLVSMPRLLADLLGLLFFAGTSFRLLIGAAGLAIPQAAPARDLSDADLPSYTILVPLRQEAELVPELLAAIDRIDYPRSKLEVLILVEPEDLATRAALAAARLPPWLHVTLGPIGGALRTKPRALNIGLSMARGTMLTVYDAEDRPDPDQLRKAAAAFAESPELACAQARLAIDNGACSRLARLFAIEYAALFDILNVGTARLRLPLALGGTSNHFRTSVLRAVGGWDAWNVTEDADLGLRLARHGWHVGCLASTTTETAPDRLGVWMKQRRRWTKGWMQTFLVLAGDAPRVAMQLGFVRSAALALLLVNLVIGPLLFSIFCGVMICHLAVAGLPTPHGLVEIAEATLTIVVPTLGLASTLWCGYAGLRRRGPSRFVASLPLLLPYQMMISVAAWMGVVDLLRRPYHWHKTAHRPVTRPPEIASQAPQRPRLARFQTAKPASTSAGHALTSRLRPFPIFSCDRRPSALLKAPSFSPPPLRDDPGRSPSQAAI